ncbi:hypothetical protein Q427_21140 [Halomonas sp. BC04]|nr:hypothetical protein Q427_21140 [Halomonas sp. BC04]
MARSADISADRCAEAQLAFLSIIAQLGEQQLAKGTDGSDMNVCFNRPFYSDVAPGIS